jgi:3D (Asp-Asp-Asp) domain-containing protein
MEVVMSKSQYLGRKMETTLSCVAMVFLIVTAAVGCGQNYQLQENSSDSKYGPEYLDFADLPLPESPEIDNGTEKGPVSESKTKEVPTVPPQEATSPVTSPKSPTPPPASSLRAELKKTNTGIGTVYYLPVYGEKRNCPKAEYSVMKDDSEKKLVVLCKDEVANCAMQGSCFYLDESGVTLFAYRKMVKIKIPETQKIISQPRFRKNKNFEMCPQGMGAHNVCLDPYRSVAADPLYHKIGDVIYLPLLRDQKLPNGETHDGYFIVRDTGGAIKGEGRFDFFIGFDDYHGHLFSKLNLAGKKPDQFIYHLVPDDIAEKVRVGRRFPLAPVKVHDSAYARMKDILGLDIADSDRSESNAFYKIKWN